MWLQARPSNDSPAGPLLPLCLAPWLCVRLCGVLEMERVPGGDGRGWRPAAVLL